MRYLLDTHTFIWSITDPARLSTRVRDLIEDPDNDILLSCASAWEIAIKAGLGRMQPPRDVAEHVPEQLLKHGFIHLPIELPHVLAVARLPLLHRDPFDRLLVCQAQLERLPLLTSDPNIQRYQVPVIW